MPPWTPDPSTARLEADVETLRSTLPPPPAPIPNPYLVLLCGLPGSGKTHFSRLLAAEVPMVVIESDAARKTLAGIPAYNSDENRRVFSACRRLIQDLLEEGVPVLLDATNVTEGDRGYSHEAASAKGADVVVVKVTAPETLISKRLKRREQGKSKDGASEAGWDVYKRIKAREQQVLGPHFVVDTSKDITPSIRKIAGKLKSKSGD